MSTLEKLIVRLKAETPHFFKIIYWIAGTLSAMSAAYLIAKEQFPEIQFPVLIDKIVSWGLFVGAFIAAFTAKSVVKDPADLNKTIQQINYKNKAKKEAGL